MGLVNRILISLIIIPLIAFSACEAQEATMAISGFRPPEMNTDRKEHTAEGGASGIVFSRKNPFLSIAEEAYFNQPHKVVSIIEDYVVSAIFCSPDKAEDKAIINGMISKVGDEIGTVNRKKIVEIQPKEVILQDMNGLEYLLRLDKGSKK